MNIKTKTKSKPNKFFLVKYEDSTIQTDTETKEGENEHSETNVGINVYWEKKQENKTFFSRPMCYLKQLKFRWEKKLFQELPIFWHVKPYRPIPFVSNLKKMSTNPKHE